MIAVTASIPDAGSDRPPLLLIHGAANSARCWQYWQSELAVRGWSSHAVDLRGHGRSDSLDLSRIRMHDYAADAAAAAAQLAGPPVVVGWSMGGLVALMLAASGAARACVGLAPSTPAREVDASIPLREGEFGPEEYAITSRDPREQPSMPDLDLEEREAALASLDRESRLARDERKRGVPIETLPCPLLIVTGTADAAWPRKRYDDLWLPADYREVEGASHWGLVLSRRALADLVPTVLEWLESRV